jgi:hypothetical protein
MQESARRQPVAGGDDDEAPTVALPRPFQLGRPGKPAQDGDGHFVKGLSIRMPAVHVRGGHEAVDVLAPEGVTDHHVYIGQAVAYFADVFAQDNCDSEVDVQVDNSQVDMNAAGTYQVTYTATDSSGNKTQASCSFTFVEETVTDEQLHGAAQQVLSEITTADMSIGDKAYAIFKYVNTHIKYNGISNKNDYKCEAYRGITEGRGDCFTFYATARCLLDEIGAQTMCVERWGSKTKTTHHYWVLANLGTGWYHFDAINVGPRNFDCFMKTDKELLGRGPNWWSFNKALYPRTPDESFVR